MIAKPGKNYGYHVHGEEICGCELLWAIVGMFHYWAVSISDAVILVIVSVIQTVDLLIIAVRNVAVKLHCNTVTLNAGVEIVEIYLFQNL